VGKDTLRINLACRVRAGERRWSMLNMRPVLQKYHQAFAFVVLCLSQEGGGIQRSKSVVRG